MAQPPANWRVSIKALIRNKQGEVLLVSEDTDHWWGLPGGGLDHGESPQIGLRRELREELGADVAHAESAPSFVCAVTAKGDNPENRPDRKYKLWLVYRVELAGPPQSVASNRYKWFEPQAITPDILADYFGPVCDEFLAYVKTTL